jgi:hypothetical protein
MSLFARTFIAAAAFVFSLSSQAYQDDALPDIKRHMLTELYKLTEIDRTLASFERNAFLPALQQTEGWNPSEHQCILATAHDYLQEPLFNALLAELPSELLARNVLFFSKDFGKKVNRVVIHGKGLSGLEAEEQNQLKKNVDVITFLGKLSAVANQTIKANMKPALTPGILDCTPVPDAY